MAVSSVESLIEDLLEFLRKNPDGDVADFAADHGCTVEDVAEGWSNYFNSVEFNRGNVNNIDSPSGYTPSAHPSGGGEAADKEWITREVQNFYEYNTTNNIHNEDNSFNQNIQALGDVDLDQDLDIDNSDNTVGDKGILIRDSDVDESNLNTGDRAVQDSEDVNTGDVTTTASGGGQANSGLNFGDGNLQQANQANKVEVDTGDATGGAGGAATGGAADAGGGAGGGVDAGDGGAGGAAARRCRRRAPRSRRRR